MSPRPISVAVAAIAMLGCGTDPSSVDLTGNWHIVAHVHAADLTPEQQSCVLDMGLIIRSDSLTSVIGGVQGNAAVGDTTGTFQCVLYGQTATPTPRNQGVYFVVTRDGGQVNIYQLNTGLLAFQGAIRGETRMSGPVGPEVLGIGTWVGTRSTGQ
jgi:hypothetical protein